MLFRSASKSGHRRPTLEPPRQRLRRGCEPLLFRSLIAPRTTAAAVVDSTCHVSKQSWPLFFPYKGRTIFRTYISTPKMQTSRPPVLQAWGRQICCCMMLLSLHRRTGIFFCNGNARDRKIPITFRCSPDNLSDYILYKKIVHIIITISTSIS